MSRPNPCNVNLIDQFQLDINTALKAGNKEKVSTLRFVRSILLNTLKSSKVEFTSDVAIQVLAKEVKKRKDAIAEFGSRSQEYKEGLEKEIEILMPYLPEQLSEEDIREIAIEVIKEGVRNFGLVMKRIMFEVNGKADGKVVSNIVKEMLN